MVEENTVVEQPEAAQPGEARPGEALSKPILKRFAINVASLFSVHVANMLLPLLTVPYVVRIIGPERLGLLNFSQAFIGYFTLLINYGFDIAAVRTIAANRDDKELVNKVFSEVVTGKIILWVLSTLIFGVISFFDAEFREHIVLHICTFISCIGIVFFPIWLYQGMEDLGRVAVFNMVVKVLFTLTVFVLIKQPEDYIYQNLSLSVAQVLISFVAFAVAIRRFKITFKLPPVADMLQRFKADSTLFFTSVVTTIYSGSNLFLLGLFGTAYSVGIFSAGTRIEGILRSFVGLALNQAFFPIVARAFGQSYEEGLQIVRMIFFPVLVFMIVVSAGLWLIAPTFITLFYGDKFHDAIAVLRIVSLLPITIGMSNVLGIHGMLNLRMDKAFFKITGIGSIISLALNSVMIPALGHEGVAWSWVITEGYITLAFYVYLRYKGIHLIQLDSLRGAVAFTKNRIGSLLKRNG